MTKEEVYKYIDQHYRNNFIQLVKIFTRYTGVPANAEDVIQEGYSRALLYWNAFPDNLQDADRYLRRIFNNCRHDAMKDERQQGMSKESGEEPIIDCAGYPMMILQQVKDLLMKKEAPYDKVLYLICFDQYDTRTVAAATGVSEGNVRQIAFRFREEINKRFNLAI